MTVLHCCGLTMRPHAYSPNRAQRFMCRVCGKTRQERVRGDRRILEAAEAVLKESFSGALSLRKAAVLAGVSRSTAATYFQSFGERPQCPCGGRSDHQGWCPSRFQLSPVRQRWLQRAKLQTVGGRMPFRQLMAPARPRSPEETQYEVVRRLALEGICTSRYIGARSGLGTLKASTCLVYLAKLGMIRVHDKVRLLPGERGPYAFVYTPCFGVPRDLSWWPCYRQIKEERETQQCLKTGKKLLKVAQRLAKERLKRRCA